MSKMKTTLVVAVLALVLAGTAMGSSFSKRTLSDAHVGRGKSELIAQKTYSNTVLHFFQHHHWMTAPRHANCWSHVPWSKTCNRARQIVRLHERLYREANDELFTLYPEVFYPAIPSYLVADFTCIHRYEGAWTSNTGNGYHGGMQMDYSFEHSYGSDFIRRWGDAENWPAWAQLTASYRAYASGRGFSPWPNTARACGLL